MQIRDRIREHVLELLVVIVVLPLLVGSVLVCLPLLYLRPLYGELTTIGKKTVLRT